MRTSNQPVPAGHELKGVMIPRPDGLWELWTPMSSNPPLSTCVLVVDYEDGNYSVSDDTSMTFTRVGETENPSAYLPEFSKIQPENGPVLICFPL